MTSATSMGDDASACDTGEGDDDNDKNRWCEGSPDDDDNGDTKVMTILTMLMVVVLVVMMVMVLMVAVN